MVRAGQAAPQLHAARDRLLRRGRADLGHALGGGGDREAARGPRVAADGERDPARVRRRVAVLLLLGRRQRGPGEAPGAVRRVLRRAAGERRARQLGRGAGAGDRRLRLHQEPRYARRRRARRPRGRDHAPIRARLVAAWARGDLGQGVRRAAAARLPDHPRRGHLRARRGSLARREDVRLQRERSGERGGPTPAAVRPRRARDRVRARAQPRMVRLQRRRQHRHVAHGHGPARPRRASRRALARTSSTTASSASSSGAISRSSRCPSRSTGTWP